MVGHAAVEECDDLATGAGVVGSKKSVSDALGDVFFNSPKNSFKEIILIFHQTQQIFIDRFGRIYITIDINKLKVATDEEIENYGNILSNELRKLMDERSKLWNKHKKSKNKTEVFL